MAIINPAIGEAVALVLRQAASTTASAATSLASSSITPSATTTPAPSPSLTSSGPPASSSTSDVANGGGNGGGGGGNPNSSQSSPLLFFVALGFGVVFTNLWIIVGVKYCFRYNARNRQMRLNEDGEPITLENMPRPHRRRREKKLMTMDEVNEKFPMLKYKNWVAGRAKEGLPTRGGVSVPPSRANSVRSVEGIVPELPPKERDSTEERPPTSATSKEKNELKSEPKESTSAAVADASDTPAEGQTSTEGQTEGILPKVTTRASDEHYQSDEDDDEHINAALPVECLGTAGDTCAICIDTLEDDDDVRGLTCGHAFHAVCLDPWLTSRRACCPLCKADYYTPKPRPPGTENADGTPGIVAVSLPDHRNRMNMHSRPQAAFFGGRFPGSRLLFGGHDGAADRTSGQTESSSRRRGVFRRGPQSPSATTTPEVTVGQTSPTSPVAANQNGWFSNLRSGFPPLRLNHMRRNNNPQPTSEQPVAAGANPAAVSPSQLEAGVRS